MTTDEDKVSRRYRELAREEPPRHVDDAILAAARRAVHTRPAPLVVPSGRQRWYFPVAAAAIIVLAVAVTMNVEREQPAEEIAATQSAPDAAPPSAREFKQEEAPPAQPERRRQAAERPRELQKAPEAVAAPAPPPATAGRMEAAQPRADDAARKGPRLAASSMQSPEQWLQGIADLRGQGWHDEADRQLAEFRKRYPEYRIAEEMLRKVERPR